MHFRQAIVWQKAVQLAEHASREAARMRPFERFSLGTQITRSAVSVASNIAEGWARESRREKAQFLSIAQGSLDELGTQLTICRRLGWMPGEALSTMERLQDDVGRILTILRRRVRRPPRDAPSQGSSS